MTDQEFQAWCEDQGALRTVLVEAVASVDGVETTFYWATRGYTVPGVVGPVMYLGIVSTGVRFTERISLSNDASLSAGDLELHNLDGRLDEYLTYVWTNRRVRAWIGDLRWPREDFRLIFDGIAAGMDSKGPEKLNLKLRDKLQRLNTPVTEVKLGASAPGVDEDALSPLVFGEVHNMTPVLVNEATLEHRVHQMALAQVIEVRDNGKPVLFTQNAAAGTFTLEDAPEGAITCSVQGDAPAGEYTNRIAPLVQRLVTGFGKAEDRFTVTDIDAASFAALDAACPQPVGLPILQRTNVLEACRRLASSVGAQLVMSALGKLRLLRISLPPTGSTTHIYPEHMVGRKLRVAERPDVKAAVKLGFCQNHTVQKDLLTTIPAAHKELFAKEWLTETKEDAAVKVQYRLHAEPVQQDTALLRRTDAAAEAQRQLDLWKVQRHVYEFDAYPALLPLELGQTVTLHYPRFGLDAGVQGIVVMRAAAWDNARVQLGILI